MTVMDVTLTAVRLLQTLASCKHLNLALSYANRPRSITVRPLGIFQGI